MRSLTLSLLLIACSHATPVAKSDPASTPPPTVIAPASSSPAASTATSHSRYFTAAGAPDPLACKTDKDCLSDTLPDPGGCCVKSAMPYPQSWPYHTWLSEYARGPSCKSANCGPPSAPPPPPDCSSDNHCTSGRCTNTCK